MLLPLERLLRISKAGVLWGLCSTLPCGDLISQDFNKLICVLICLNFLVAYKLPSGKVYLYPSTPSYPWHIANTWKMVFKKFLNEWILATSFLSFLLWFGCICLSKGSWAETVIFSGEVWRERKFYEVWPRGESTHHYLFGPLSPLSLFHRLTPSFLLCCTQRARTKTSKCQAHASETPKLWEKEMHLLYKVYNTKYFVSVMENRLILLTLSRGLFCQWAILDSGGWQDHVANYCNWICCKRFFGLEKGLFT